MMNDEEPAVKTAANIKPMTEWLDNGFAKSFYAGLNHATRDYIIFTFVSKYDKIFHNISFNE